MRTSDHKVAEDGPPWYANYEWKKKAAVAKAEDQCDFSGRI